MLSEKTTILIKLEGSIGGTIGVEGTGDQAVHAEDLVINPTGTLIKREGAGLYLGPDTTGIIGGRTGKCTFTTEMRTDGSQAFDAGLAILLQACGFKKTANIYTIATYAEQETLTIDVYEDGVLKTLYGSMGTFTMEYEEGKRVLYKFDFDGHYKDEDEVGLSSYVPTGNTMMGGTGVFTVLTESHKISKFALDMNNNVVPRHDVTGVDGIGYFMISVPRATASWDPEANLITTGGDADNMHADWLDGTTGTLLFSLSDGVDKVTLECAKVQYTDIPEGMRNNLRIHEVTAQCLQSANSTDMVKFTVASGA